MDLIERREHLPATAPELHRFLLIGKEKLKAHQAKLAAIDKAGIAHAAKDAALQDSQDLAVVLLDAEARLGKLLAETVQPRGEKQKGGSSQRTTLPSLPPGMTKKESHLAQMVASNPEVVKKVIERATEQERIPTAQEVYKEVKRKKIKEHHEELRAAPLPEEKYAVILADPPWQYDNTGFFEAAESQYPTMPVDEICEMPVFKLATDRTILFLWATNPLLPEALKVLDSWGFKYKTNIVWVKDKGRGKGWFLKSKHEILLIGVMDNTPQPADRPDSCFEAPRRMPHSRKPEKSYEIIEAMYPGSFDSTYYVELFARGEARRGWKTFGNEI